MAINSTDESLNQLSQVKNYKSNYEEEEIASSLDDSMKAGIDN